jgi:hypothetical protein
VKAFNVGFYPITEKRMWVKVGVFFEKPKQPRFNGLCPE